jgi:ADP-ribosylglycohydrolase
VAEHLLDGTDLAGLCKTYYEAYPNAGFGGMFHRWARSADMRPYNSFGNGSAMRASPVGFAFETMDEVLERAERSAVITHDHPEGIKGAQAVAAAIYLARTGSDKEAIEDFIARTFGYAFDRTLDQIREHYDFNVTCQGSVPQAITAFLDSDDYEDAIRKAISLGGDSDTIACMAGGIAQAYYGGVPAAIEEQVFTILDDRLARVVQRFRERFGC